LRNLLGAELDCDRWLGGSKGIVLRASGVHDVSWRSSRKAVGDRATQVVMKAEQARKEQGQR
jgi:hypothetical protein